MKCGRDLLRQARGGNHEDVGSTSRNRRRRAGERRRLAQAIGRDVSRFQEASYTFDDVAAEILALNRSDLPIMTMLLFGGPASADELAAVLHVRRPLVSATLERLRLAGYARFQPGAGPRIKLTGHARKWIERIWAALRQEGLRLIDRCSTPDLAVIAAFLRQACAVQESRTAKLRAWLALPSSPARRSHLRGGLSPAALQRVQVFIEANLGAPIHLHDLAARAGLSHLSFRESVQDVLRHDATGVCRASPRRVCEAFARAIEATDRERRRGHRIRHAEPADHGIQAPYWIHASRISPRTHVT